MAGLSVFCVEMNVRVLYMFYGSVLLTRIRGKCRVVGSTVDVDHAMERDACSYFNNTWASHRRALTNHVTYTLHNITSCIHVMTMPVQLLVTRIVILNAQ